MKKIFAVVGILLGVIAGAQTPKTLLWKISGNSLQAPSYLFGTIHMTCDATLKPKVLQALDNTEQLCLELDMDDPSLQMIMMSGMQMKKGNRLDSLLTPNEFQVVDQFLKTNLGFSAKMMNTIKPFMITAMLYPKMLDCPMQSVEQELMKVTKTQNEEVIGLEKVLEQMAVFDQIPYKEQAQELYKLAQKGISFKDSETEKMLQFYAQEDLDGLMQLFSSSESQFYSEFENELLTKRNKNWQERIPKIIQAKTTFIGVGAAHLGGKNGVIQLLKELGYKVEPVL